VGSFAIFYILFSRDSFYQPFLKAMDVSDGQFGVLYGVYGWIAVISYPIGGVIADKISPRMMMFLSFFGTGVCNIILGFFPGYNVCMVLYAVMGVTTAMTFWAAMLKCVRIFGRNIGEENRAFSFLEITRGIASVVISFTIVYIFNQFADMVVGLRFVIWFYGSLLLLLSVISLLVFDKADEEKEMQTAAEEKAKAKLLSDKTTLQHVADLVKNPDMWLAVAIAFGGYNIGSCMGSYVGDMAGRLFGISVGGAAYIGVMNNSCKPIGAFIGSFITKRRGPTFVLQAVTWMYVAILLIFLVIPKNSNWLWLFLVLMACEMMGTGAFRSQKFIQIKEANLTVAQSGTAFGLIAMIIYSADAFMPMIIGHWLDSGDYVRAYAKLNYTLLGSAALTLCAVIYWRIRNRDNIKRQLEMEAMGQVS
jgi:predicted MFS family arabinose efflux permease